MSLKTYDKLEFLHIIYELLFILIYYNLIYKYIG